jgi:hypothetical protein
LKTIDDCDDFDSGVVRIDSIDRSINQFICGRAHQQTTHHLGHTNRADEPAAGQEHGQGAVVVVAAVVAAASSSISPGISGGSRVSETRT